MPSFKIQPLHESRDLCIVLRTQREDHMNLGIKDVDAGVASLSLPVTHWGSLCFLTPQLWALQDGRFWSPNGGYHLAKGHSQELQVTAAAQALWTPRG